jgi:hypothetical protein
MSPSPGAEGPGAEAPRKAHAPRPVPPKLK